MTVECGQDLLKISDVESKARVELGWKEPDILWALLACTHDACCLAWVSKCQHMSSHKKTQSKSKGHINECVTTETISQTPREHV